MNSNYQKTDNDKQGFKKVEIPSVGSVYHLSWAYKGARFTLTEITDNVNGIVWTGASNNKYLKIKLSDLRHLRNQTT